MVGLPLSNYPAHYSVFSERIRHKLMLKLVPSGEDTRNSGSMRLYVTERVTEFTCVDDKALQSCELSINVYLMALKTT